MLTVTKHCYRVDEWRCRILNENLLFNMNSNPEPDKSVFSSDVQCSEETERGSRGEQDVGGHLLQGARRLRRPLKAPWHRRREGKNWVKCSEQNRVYVAV